MKVFDDIDHTWLDGESVITIGAFDGVHVGHQALVREVLAEARESGRQAGVVTFYPHPVNVLSAQNRVRYITTPGEKAAILERLGIDFMALMQFTMELARKSAGEFVHILVEHLHPKSIWVGPDFTFGYQREGNVEVLRRLGAQWGFSVHVLPAVCLNGAVVSSTRIRQLLAEGKIEEVTALLGRYYLVSGEVVPGRHRGRALGFPTANLEVRGDRALPRDGVYACFALLGQQRFPAVANLGVRPTFGETKHILEVHLLDVSLELYGCDLAVEFVRWMRPEKRFDSAGDLVEQMRRDAAEARRILREARLDGVDIAIRDWSLLRVGGK